MAERVIRIRLEESPVATLILRRGSETVEVRAAAAFDELVDSAGSEEFLRLHGDRRVNVSALHAQDEVVVLPQYEHYSTFAEAFRG